MNRHWTGLRHGPMRARFAALALVAVMARALIPMGFMPVVVHGEAQLVFCDGDSAHAHHHGQPGSPSSANGPCVYTIGGGVAPIPAKIVVELFHVAARLALPVTEQSALAEAPPRYTAPRGPPRSA